MLSLQLFHYQWSFSRYTKISVGLCNPGTQVTQKKSATTTDPSPCPHLQSIKQFFLKLPTTEQTTVRISAKS